MEAAAAGIIAKIRAVAAPGHTANSAAHDSDRAERPAARGPRHANPGGDFEPQVLALAASTGGPNALAAVISGLPRDFPLPVLVTQHMPPIFTTMFAQRLGRESMLECGEAREGEVVRPGHVYVAPGDHHLMLVPSGVMRGPTIHVSSDPPEHHCRPAANPMFRTAASGISWRCPCRRTDWHGR